LPNLFFFAMNEKFATQLVNIAIPPHFYCRQFRYLRPGSGPATACLLLPVVSEIIALPARGAKKFMLAFTKVRTSSI
jgi:hypothetical protein